MAAIADLSQRLEALEAKLVEPLERNAQLERENKILREENAILKRGRFGRSSERLEPGQLALFLAEAAAPPAPQKVEVPAHERVKGGHGRAPFADHLPRRIHEYDVPEDERSCSCCGKALRLIGEDVKERGHITPAQIVVNRYVIFASKRGGEGACRLYSLVLSCRPAEVDTQAYMDVLQRVSTTPAKKIATLTPWAWAPAARC